MAFTPAIGSVDLAAQNASIGAANLIASAPPGLYRISYYIHTTTAGSAGTVLLTLAWNDGVAQTFLTSALTLAAVVAGTIMSGTVVVKSASGQAITYATTVAGVIGSPAYALGIRIERIG